MSVFSVGGGEEEVEEVEEDGERTIEKENAAYFYFTSALNVASPQK